jgi:hypothetical protein
MTLLDKLQMIGVHPRNRLLVPPSGRLEIWLVDKAFPRQRANTLARQVEGMGRENIPSS